MFRTTTTKLAGVAVVVCAFVVAPQAFATTNVHGVKTAYISEGRSPDTLDAAAKTSALDPAITAAIASHRTSATAADKRSPDTADAAARAGALDPAIAVAVASHRTSATAADKRSPDTRDATGAIEAPTASPQLLPVAGDSVFDWTDAGVGAAAGFAIALLLGGMILLSHRGRHGSLAV